MPSVLSGTQMETSLLLHDEAAELALYKVTWMIAIKIICLTLMK